MTINGGPKFKLSFCPFCKGKPEVVYGMFHFDDAEVSCECGISGPNIDTAGLHEDRITTRYINGEEAARLWNVRYSSRPSSGRTTRAK